ncbi:hypothetical protein L1987_38739 [Smallanthus sonchifolius]|uniref:Uncharacterized protein n=1 Tax=Smallanthus sonchifolius TaxID=185202 RepID=A0ACB9HLE4_9ASTR|nr:hypothetical protein L1987_38739 [Smallanthus sonchifolius]
MNSFMSSIKSAAASAVTGGDEKKTNPDQSSNSDLMSSAKMVAEAAQCAATNQSDKIDKPKVAGAAADLLDAAKDYGKFDETQGVGQYLKQADDYLHQYEKSGTTATPPAEAPPATEEKKDEAPAPPAEEKKAEAPPPAEEKKEESGSEFGAADAIKAAGSFFK